MAELHRSHISEGCRDTCDVLRLYPHQPSAVVILYQNRRIIFVTPFLSTLAVGIFSLGREWLLASGFYCINLSSTSAASDSSAHVLHSLPSSVVTISYEI